MPSFSDLPYELFVHNLFPFLPIPDILRLASTNRFFKSLADDEAFWHARIKEDFNFSGSGTARATGWKFLYKRLSDPSLHVWGEDSHGRLGFLHPLSVGSDAVPYPVQLHIPGVRVVSLVAGGMCFHAIDTHGDIYVWGVLKGIGTTHGAGFAHSCEIASHPMRLKLPVKFRSLSCGRFHTTALDAASQVWTFTSWGCPFSIRSPRFDKSSPDTTPIQVESGWMFSSVLIDSGDVFVYWPSGHIIKRVTEAHQRIILSSHNTQLREAAMARPTRNEPHVIPCYPWYLPEFEPVLLPPIPAEKLPVLRCTGLTQAQLDRPTKLVKIAGFDNSLIGLTNKGHVLRYGELRSEQTYQNGHWEYLPLFSDIQQIKDLPVYVANAQQDHSPFTAQDTMHIVHISASFQTFFAYSSPANSVVLMGKHISDQRTRDVLTHQEHDLPINRFEPTIIPELQNQSVISIVVGDYHYGALTSTGKLLTWGAFSKGALGRVDDPSDDPPLGEGSNQDGQWSTADLKVPKEVSFGGGEAAKKKYCFAAAAMGWHTGALVIDLEPDQPEEVNERSEKSRSGWGGRLVQRFCRLGRARSGFGPRSEND